MSPQEAVDEMVEALTPLMDEIPGLQVYRRPTNNPTPPAIDIYPGNPFQVGAAFGLRSKKVFWTVRARVSAADEESAYELLYRMLDVDDAASVEAALVDVAVVGNEGEVSSFTQYVDDVSGEMFGVQWRVEMFV
jgi:hypothetical protein